MKTLILTRSEIAVLLEPSLLLGALQFSYVSLEQRVPADHPLRAVRKLVDAVLGTLSPEFDALYAASGRPIAPVPRQNSIQSRICPVSNLDHGFCELLPDEVDGSRPRIRTEEEATVLHSRYADTSSRYLPREKSGPRLQAAKS
jgi:hypothetical protein